MGKSVLNITNIEHVKNKTNKDISYGIDSPRVDFDINTNAINISGWAYCERKKIVEIHIMSLGRKVKSAKLNLPRTDVVSKLLKFRDKSVCGFNVDIGLVGFPENIDIRIRVVFEDDSFALIAKVSGTYTSSPFIVGNNKITPILLNSMGRMGTTYMMKLLKSHPIIVTTDEYPYEDRPSQYWTHMFKVLSEPANYDESVNTDQFFSTNYMVGNNPFFSLNRDVSSWYDDVYLDIVGGFVNNSINEYYYEQASKQGKEGVGFFIEKMMSPNALFWDMYNKVHGDVKNIFLVRDIRDVFCSVQGFNKKRGYMSFGVRDSMNSEQYFQLLKKQYTAMYSRWENNEANSILVKYEDLIQDPHAALVKILDYLDVDADPAIIEDMVAEINKKNNNMKIHQTSSSPMNSIGRWKYDLDPDLAVKANETFKDVLTCFGYDQ